MNQQWNKKNTSNDATLKKLSTVLIISADPLN